MSKYDLARMDCYNRVFAASIGRDGRLSYAAHMADEALRYFENEFPRPEEGLNSDD